MGDHDDETVVRDLGEKRHHLFACRGIERARGLVGEQDLRVVDERASDGDALHLSTRELVRPLADVIAEADLRERVYCTLPALGAGDAREREGEFHVREHGLVRDEVVALKDEADAIVAVRVPVAIPEVLSRDTIDDQVAGVVAVEAADDVEKRCLSRARRAEDGYELVLSK